MITLCCAFGQTAEDAYSLLLPMCIINLWLCTYILLAKFIFSHPPADKVTSDIKVPLYPARDVPYELLIKAFVGQKTRYSVRITIATAVEVVHVQ